MNKLFYQEEVALYEMEKVVPLLTQLELVPGTAEHSLHSSVEDIPEDNHIGVPVSSATKQCFVCQETFDNREEYVAHYTTNWHTANVKRNLVGKRSLLKDDYQIFMENFNDDDTDSCNSQDESEDEVNKNDDFEEKDEVQYNRSSRVFFKNHDGQIVSMYRSLIYQRKESPKNREEILYRARRSMEKLYWVIVLVGSSGDFSAAVFKGSEIILHKTCHLYVTRAKQGKAQLFHDQQKSMAKSAGAQIRRQNMQKFIQKIHEVLASWKEHLDACDLIFTRYPSRMSKYMYAPRGPFDRQDSRMHNIPFSIQKASFNEVKRIQKFLSSITIHSQADFEKCMETIVKRPSKPKSKQKPRKPKSTSPVETVEEPIEQTSSSSADEIELVWEDEIVSFIEAEPIHLPLENSEAKLSKAHQSMLKDILYTTCAQGNICLLERLWDFCEHKPSGPVYILPEPLQENIKLCNVNVRDFKFGKYNRNYLHVAALSGKCDLTWRLLSIGFDPSVADDQNKTPYQLTTQKDTINKFRLFMGQFPDKYDYQKSCIPGPLTQGQIDNRILKNKKRKEAQKAKEKLRIQKEEQEKQELKRQKEKLAKEKAEAKRYSNLSEREKRALAAERRFKATESNAVLLRCFQCGIDITGKVPFSCNENSFCSTACIREMRKQLAS